MTGNKTLRHLFATFTATLLTATFATGAALAQAAEPLMGQPTPDGLGLQPAANPLAEQAAAFHNQLLMPIITAITILVLVLLLWIIIRFREGANPTPSKTTHNVVLEIAWTVIPVVILAVIAVPSFRLLYGQYEDKPADVTIKVIGNQWYWSYEYPDLNEHAFDAVMLTREEAIASGQPALLATDNHMVVPAGGRVKLLITSNDVMHSWTIPAIKMKMDAVPGRSNEMQFDAPSRPGLYYGQCSELCGIRHGFMPITMEVLAQADYDNWARTASGEDVADATPQPEETLAAAPAAAEVVTQ